MLKNAAIATLILSSTALATTLPAHALELGRYNFENTTNRLAPSNVDPSVTLSDFGSNGDVASGFNAGNSGGLGFQSSNWSATFDSTKYLTFSIQPNSGTQLNLNSLAFEARLSSTGPTTIEVRSSADSYGAPIQTFNPTRDGIFRPLLISLSSPSFQNLSAPTEFKIYGYGGASGGTFRVDNVVLDGTTQTAVPVPFGFTPIWGIAANGVVFGLRKLKNKQMRSGSQGSVKA